MRDRPGQNAAGPVCQNLKFSLNVNDPGQPQKRKSTEGQSDKMY